MRGRKPIPHQIETEVLTLSRRRCALCFALQENQEEQKGQIAHIDQNPSDKSFSNLVFLCLRHHDAYDSRSSQSKGYTHAELRHWRDRLYESLDSNQKIPREEGPSVSLKQGHVDTEMLKYLWDDIYESVFAGFTHEYEIASEVIKMYSDEYDAELITPYVVTITQQLLAEHRKQQKEWPTITDCNRLDFAFAELEGNGIVCRQDFCDCQSCGYSEIWDEIKTVIEAGQHVRGFAFFHMQDTTRAVRDRELYLCYRSTSDGEAADLEIAREVVETIRRHGLKVDWDITINHRIGVTLDWKKRR